MGYFASGECEIKYTFNEGISGTQTYSSSAYNELYSIAIDSLIENLNELVDKFFLLNSSYQLIIITYTNINCFLSSPPINNEDNLYIEYPIINTNANAPGVFISINFYNGNVLVSPVFSNLIDAVTYINYILDKLVLNISQLLITTYTITINPGESYVKKGNQNDFDAEGIFNCCSETPILDLYIGNEKLIINKFEIGGSGAANMNGSCRFIIYNLSALPPNNYEENRQILNLPRTIFHNFNWVGSLWIDFIYTNLTIIDVNYNKYGMRYYSIDGIQVKTIPNNLNLFPWINEDIADNFYMTNVSVQLPRNTLVTVTNPNIYRIKPLFYLNSFACIEKQIWSCNFWSFAAENQTGDPPPLVYICENLLLGNNYSNHFMHSCKLSSEIFGQYLPRCLRIDNTYKLTILCSTLTGQTILEANSVAVTNTYLLGIGTIDGFPLSEINPISKSLIFQTIYAPPVPPFNISQGNISIRPYGILAPSRFLLSDNQFVSNVNKSITPELYSDPIEAIRHLPWIILNTEGKPAPISKFSSILYWHVSVRTNTQLIKTYDAILLTNIELAKVALK